MTQRVRVTVTGVTIAERSPLRLSLPPPSSGIWDVFAGDVAETSTFAQLLDTIRERHPLILSHFHAFRYAGNDWKRSPDLDIDSTVKAAVDGWPAFYNKFAREQRPLILPSESLELRIVVKQQRVAEIEQQVIAVEGQYWANFQAIKYLKSLAEMSESDTKLLKIHTNRLCGCVNSLKRMRDHWAVCLPSGCEQASSPTLITVPLSTWLSDMRCRLSERSRVPSTVDTHFLPHLQRLLNTPPPGFTSLWETNTEMVEAMSSTRYSPTDEVAHVKLDDYRRRKTIELDQITDEEIQTEIARQSGRSSAPPTSTSNGAHPPVSSSFLSSPLVQHALSQQYPNLTESAKRKTFKTVWSLLDDAARSPWWRRDAWLEKGKAAKRQDLSDHKSTRSDYSESTRFNDSESETVEAHGAGETAVPASESKAGEQTSASEDRPKRTEPTVTVRVPRGPFSFTITSGTVALWGQLPLIAYAGVMSSSSTDAEQTTRAASPASALDGPTTLPKRLTGGTILQHQFHYRSPARRGAWLVTPFHANTLDSDLVGESMEDDGVFVGWVVHHEDVDPGEAVVRASRVGSGRGGISHANAHTDNVNYRRTK
ncbi:hypothetical protein M427DRAFT_134135 [Gonapodya prolifera JEL478]|uniref:Uncharacterized protein n=1 Tax=Gonapodya prolifera (strain JEL478) TaxID=1344416 RepID=A0A139AI99_GONPJ|nr:hypothetical protein M427DRAFT_134135 [Gonapodya prolifera JEL478]|eukprot:KXS16532.1 hypothetical protein M427DRAFT_134135 [Gonapodya prolifera JEL478]